MNKSKGFLLAGALALLSAVGAAHASTVAAPIYNLDGSFFGTGGSSASIQPTVAGNYRFTVSPVTVSTPLILAPEVLAFFVRENGVLTSPPGWGRSDAGSIFLDLTAGQTYFINVLGKANPASFLQAGFFNLEVVQVIPIPAAAVLFSSALVGLVVVARRRNKTGEVVTA